MSSRHRAFLGGFFGALALPLIVVGGINFIVDPFHYYRGVTAINRVFVPGFQRYQNVGLARSFRYDTVVIGSSVSENLLPSDIERSWGGTAMKLSISGSTSYEQFLILQQALRSGQVRRVIWSLDVAAFYGGARRVRDDQSPFPYFMYREPALLNIEYPLSLSTLSLSVSVLRGGGDPDLDKLDTWYQRSHFGEAAVLATWSGNCAQFAQKYQRGRSELPPPIIDQLHLTARENLVSVVRAHREIAFYLFFPPMAMLVYIPVDSGFLAHLLPLRDFVARELGDEPNTHLFDFQTVVALAEDFGRYKDPIHFDLATSQYLIDAMREDRWRVDGKQLLANNDKLIEQVNRYDYCREHGPLADLTRD